MNKKMKVKKTISLLAVCMMVFVSLSAIMVYAPKPEDGFEGTPFQSVVVVNDETEPVPVVIGNQLETLEVTVPDGVEVTNPEGESLNVTVTNSEAITVEVTNFLELEPFQCQVYLQMLSTTHDEDVPDVPVPEGKIFVIEHIAASAYTLSLDTVWLDIKTQLDGQFIEHPLHTFELNGGVRVNFSQDVKLFSDDSGNLKASVWRNSSGTEVILHVTFSGHLIDAS